MTIYTRTGDSGETGLLGGGRVGKDAMRVETYGTVDELNALLGLARAEPLPEQLDCVLERLQHELFELGAELASPDPAAQGTRSVDAKHVEAIEADVDRLEEGLAPLEHFVTPGGTRAGATLHVARAVCRRAERRLVAAIRHSDQKISPTLAAYLNRLSDLLFVLARTVNAQAGRPETVWHKPA